MEPWHFWVVAALLLFVVEIFASGYIIVCLAMGAIGGAVAALCELSLWLQISIAVLVALFVFVSIRPVIQHYQHKGHKRHNMGPHVGKILEVTQDIPSDTVGMIKIGEYDWQVMVVDGDSVTAGDKVKVLKQDTNILKVKKL